MEGPGAWVVYSRSEFWIAIEAFHASGEKFACDPQKPPKASAGCETACGALFEGLVELSCAVAHRLGEFARIAKDLARLAQAILAKSSSFSCFSLVATPSLVGLWKQHRERDRLLALGDVAPLTARGDESAHVGEKRKTWRATLTRL